MDQNEFDARQQSYTHGVQHREIGLRAVAAAILYQGSSVESTISRELSVPPVAAMPSGDREPAGS
jgi:hypothetical protein